MAFFKTKEKIIETVEAKMMEVASGDEENNVRN